MPRALLRHILVPDRCKLHDFPAGHERWEELVRRYERSKSSRPATIALNEDIKTAAFEVCVPSEWEQNFARTVHDWSRTSRFEVKSKLTLKPAVANSHSRQLRQRSRQIRRRWPALANEARKARRARKGKVMARAPRKKVNIRTEPESK